MEHGENKSAGSTSFLCRAALCDFFQAKCNLKMAPEYIFFYVKMAQRAKMPAALVSTHVGVAALVGAGTGEGDVLVTPFVHHETAN